MVSPLGIDDTPYQEDLRLMAEVAAGDRPARERLARRLYPRMFTIARRILGASADVDDAVQTAFIEVLHGAPTYGGRSQVEAWAGRITVRSCMRIRRRERPRVELREEMVTTTGMRRQSDALPRPMEEYLTTLSEDLRSVVLMRHGLEMTVSEISEAVDAPIDTVKDRLKRARAALRKIIRREVAIGRPDRGRAQGEGA